MITDEGLEDLRISLEESIFETYGLQIKIKFEGLKEDETDN